MKLYLASLRIPDEATFSALFSTEGPKRLALITNAWDAASPEKSAPYISNTRQQLEHMGFVVEPLDLRAFEGKTDELAQTLGEYAGVWVTGGNTFYLAWVMQRCNFGEVLTRLWGKGFVYGGESAGSVVVGNTLHGIELLDNPKEDPSTPTIWQGLGLVDYGIIPHWNEPKYKDYLEKARAKMEHYGDVHTLTNMAHIVVNTDS